MIILGKVFIRFMDFSWPLWSSPDLSVCNLFFMKLLLQTLKQLKHTIQTEINATLIEILEQTMQNFHARLQEFWQRGWRSCD